jgi:hypothetical protein
MIPPRESDDAIFEKLLGAQFASGEHRTVHEVVGHPEMVMKVARYSHIANWCEYLVSSSLEKYETEFHIGSVPSISASGRFLLMERLNDLDRSLAGVAIPGWLDDVKISNFGISSEGVVKIRDYGMLKLSDQLGSQQYIFEEDRPPLLRKVPDGSDGGFSMLMGPQVGVDGARAIHEVIGEPAMVIKACSGSHKENSLEWIIHAALTAIDAEELVSFAYFECSRTGKYVLTDKLGDLAGAHACHLPSIPWWLPDDRSALGVDEHATAKIRRWADAKFGELLISTPVSHFK